MPDFDPATWAAEFEAIGGRVQFDMRSDKLWIGVDDTDFPALTDAMGSITGWVGRREILREWGTAQSGRSVTTSRPVRSAGAYPERRSCDRTQTTRPRRRALPRRSGGAAGAQWTGSTRPRRERCGGGFLRLASRMARPMSRRVAYVLGRRLNRRLPMCDQAAVAFRRRLRVAIRAPNEPSAGHGPCLAAERGLLGRQRRPSGNWSRRVRRHSQTNIQRPTVVAKTEKGCVWVRRQGHRG